MSIVPARVEVFSIVAVGAVVQMVVVVAAVIVLVVLVTVLVAVLMRLELVYMHNSLSCGSHAQPVPLVSLHLEAQVEVDRGC